MATPGDPYDTEALEEQRSRQRRWLVETPPHLLPEIRRRDPDSARVDPRQAETWLRDLADALIEELDDEAQRARQARIDVEKAATLRRLSDVLDVDIRGGGFDLAPSPVSVTMERLQNEAEAVLKAVQQATPQLDPRPYQAPIVLLVLADGFADDGFSDHRLVSRM